MKLRTSTKRLMCSLVLAAGVCAMQAAERLFIVGNAVWGGYSIDNSIVMCNSEETPDIFSATVYLESDKPFKFLTTTDWGNLEYRAGDSNKTLTPGESAPLVSTNDNAADNQFSVEASANYEVVCNLEQSTITVTKAQYQAHPINHPALWLVGDATPGGWTLVDGTRMTQNATNPLLFETTVELKAGEMKIAVNNETSFGQSFYVRDAADAGKMVLGGDDSKWKITESALYRISVDLASLTISIDKTTSNGIEASTAPHVDVPDVCYTLSGTKTSKLEKGSVVIVRRNGKAVKMVVR